MLRQYAAGVMRTTAQAEVFGTSLNIPQFGNNTHPTLDGGREPLRLLVDDGFDGRLVQAGRHGRSTARNYTGYTQYHAFASLATRVRIGLFFSLNVHTIAFLALKGEYEELLAKFSGFRTNTTPGYQDYINEEKLEIFHPIFKTKHFESVAQKIFETMNTEGELAISTWGSFERFKSLLNVIIRERHFIKTLESPEVQYFLQQEINQDEKAKKGTEEQQEDYWIEKLTWDDLLNRIDEWMLDCQNKTLENEQALLRWRAKFGKFEIEIQVLRLDVQELELKLIHKNAYPEETDEEITRKVQIKLHEKRDEVDTEKEKVEDAELSVMLYGSINGNGGAMTQSEVNDIKAQCKKLLRKIWKLTFDDVLKQNPVYEQLTEKQKKKLRDFFDESIKIKKQLGIPKGYYQYENVTAQTLQTILSRIKITLENAGIDTSSIEYSIQGDTVEAQTEWLKKENAKLENELISLQAKFRALVENADVRTKERLLQDESIHEKIIEDHKNEIEKLEEQVQKLQKKYRSMF